LALGVWGGSRRGRKAYEVKPRCNRIHKHGKSLPVSSLGSTPPLRCHRPYLEEATEGKEEVKKVQPKFYPLNPEPGIRNPET